MIVFYFYFYFVPCSFFVFVFHQEWIACLGHASLAAAAGLAERSFAAWKALAEHALARERATLGPRGGRREGGEEADGGVSQCEAAAKDLAMCCEVHINTLSPVGTLPAIKLRTSVLPS